jgi:tetratricopeptide (TPR) repeat protein
LDGPQDRNQANAAAPDPVPTDFAKPSAAAAKVLIAKGDLRKARLMLEGLVKESPDAEALLQLAQLEIDNPKRAAAALDHLKQAVLIAPEYTEAWLTLANYWSLRGQTDKQKRCLEKVLTYNPANKDVRLALELLVSKK